MLVKINSVSRKIIKVTQLDIDDFGSMLPLKELELFLPQSQLGDSLFDALQNTEFAAIFTKGDIEHLEDVDNIGDLDEREVILVNPITVDEINEEKKRIIESLKK